MYLTGLFLQFGLFERALLRLIEEPCSSEMSEFIDQFRKPIVGQSGMQQMSEVNQLLMDEMWTRPSQIFFLDIFFSLFVMGIECFVF